MATGLVIIDARYGPTDNGEALQGLTIDVTVPLQALVSKSQLYIPGRRSKVSSITHCVHAVLPPLFLHFVHFSTISQRSRRRKTPVLHPSVLGLTPCRYLHACVRGGLPGSSSFHLAAVMHAHSRLAGDCSKPLRRMSHILPRRRASIALCVTYPDSHESPVTDAQSAHRR